MPAARMKSTVKRLSLDLLTIDPLVQRIEGVDKHRCHQMAKDFRPHALGVLTVSERDDGRCVVLDGMHRVAAARMAGWHGLVNAEVFLGLSVAQEAELFFTLNDARSPSALSKFHARVLMEDPVALDITRILAAHGWRVDLSNDPGVVAAVAATERVYRNGGATVPEGLHPELLDRVFETITIAWERDSRSADAAILLGLAQLFGRFGASIDIKKLLSEMQATRPAVLVGRARTLRDAQGGLVAAAMAKILVGMHNSRRRTNLLPEWVWVR